MEFFKDYLEFLDPVHHYESKSVDEEIFYYSMTMRFNNCQIY